MIATRIEKLARHHAVEDFDCGNEALNRFLIRYALTGQLSNASQTYIGLAGDEVIGYYTLVVGEVSYEDAPERLTKGMARHPVPLMVLARMATSRQWQGKGVGTGLLKDAMRRTVNASEIAGIRAMAVHAKDEAARAFYSQFDFESSPVQSLHLYMLVKDLRRAIAASESEG